MTKKSRAKSTAKRSRKPKRTKDRTAPLAIGLARKTAQVQAKSGKPANGRKRTLLKGTTRKMSADLEAKLENTAPGTHGDADKKVLFKATAHEAGRADIEEKPQASLTTFNPLGMIFLQQAFGVSLMRSALQIQSQIVQMWRPRLG